MLGVRWRTLNPLRHLHWKQRRTLACLHSLPVLFAPVINLTCVHTIHSRYRIHCRTGFQRSLHDPLPLLLRPLPPLRLYCLWLAAVLGCSIHPQSFTQLPCASLHGDRRTLTKKEWALTLLRTVTLLLL